MQNAGTKKYLLDSNEKQMNTFIKSDMAVFIELTESFQLPPLSGSNALTSAP